MANSPVDHGEEASLFESTKMKAENKEMSRLKKWKQKHTNNIDGKNEQNNQNWSDELHLKLVTLFQFLQHNSSDGLVYEENEGGLKAVEARRCEEKLNEDCQEGKCNSDCRKKHGNSASGMCNAIEDCICNYPC
ncbi:unnamed protein product [Sphenostylis stenocarpa]|uniref:Defensin-like protein n=1 Tax=Sphenostylis stenocarpa TaxID=92480 RepID=A0AA87BDB4_9FABA|nr:unnamed protein product [Sphenostylis stenocarpa]